MKIINSIFQPHLPGANELTEPVMPKLYDVMITAKPLI